MGCGIVFLTAFGESLADIPGGNSKALQIDSSFDQEFRTATFQGGQSIRSELNLQIFRQIFRQISGIKIRRQNRAAIQKCKRTSQYGQPSMESNKMITARPPHESPIRRVCRQGVVLPDSSRTAPIRVTVGARCPCRCKSITLTADSI